MTAKQCRLLSGLTQPELAKLAKVSQQLVSRIECGECKKTNPASLEQIGLALEKRTKARNQANSSLPIVTFRDYVLSVGVST